MTTTIQDSYQSLRHRGVAYYATSSKWWRSDPDLGPFDRNEQVYLSEVLADTSIRDRKRILDDHFQMIDDLADRIRAAMLTGNSREFHGDLESMYESLCSDSESAKDEFSDYLAAREGQE